MPDYPDSTAEANDDTNTTQQSPAPPLPPSVKGHENGEGNNRQGGGNRITQKQDEPPHWTRYVEAACALALVLITATYTHYASRQAEAAITAANAAKESADWAAAAFETSDSDFQRTMSQMITQTTQQVKAANASQSAARTAQDALYISNRAYIVTGRPDVSYAEKFVTIPVENIGRAPSRKVEFVAHEATINIADPSVGGRFDQAVERSCTRGVLQNLTPNFPQSIEIPAPQMSGTAMVDGHQLTIVALDITYDDGFPNTKEQTFQFCMRNDWVEHLHNTSWRSCDAKLHIPALEKVDGYPNCAEAGIDR